MEQVNSFHYLGNLISYEKEVDFDNKLNNYCTIKARDARRITAAQIEYMRK
jgi:hypothetical protein